MLAYAANPLLIKLISIICELNAAFSSRYNVDRKIVIRLLEAVDTYNRHKPDLALRPYDLFRNRVVLKYE
ncbi:hypothetical protein D3C77_231570 [compost metagenome]